MHNPFLPVTNSLLPEPSASLLLGILFGVKATMPKTFYNALVTTGTLHIIALSGMNISILINVAAKATLFLGRKISSVLTIGLIIAFTIFVGASPSIVRAAIMGCLSLFSVYFGRQSWSLLTLFLAGGMMLVFNFSLIKDLSFQLSFLATFGIILANAKKECQSNKSFSNRLLYPLKENFRMTIFAQIFTLPVILYRFHRISLISPLANLLIEWAIQPIMILGFVAAILGSLWLPLGVIPSWFAWVPLTYMVAVIEILAKIPGASVSF